MLVFLLLFSTNIYLTQCKPCHKRSVHQICAFPSECPTRFRDECARNKPSPTAELLTSTLSSGVVTFPSVTYPTLYHVEVTETPQEDCRRSRCPAPKVCNKRKGDCSCPNHCKSKLPSMDLICGSDCRVYFSTCHFETQQCYVMPRLLTMFRRGFCPPRMNPRVKISAGDSNRITSTVNVLGTSVSLTCHVVSSQYPEITWQHKDNKGNIRTLTPRQVETTVETTFQEYVRSVSVLELLDFSEDHVGDYVCSAVMCDVQESHTVTLEKITNPVCSILSTSFLSSFDGVVYRSRFQGDFILAMDRQDFRWYILGRFRPCSREGSDYCLHSVTVHDSVRGLAVYRDYWIHGDQLWKELETGEVVSREFKKAYRVGNTTVVVLYGGDVIIEWDNMMGIHITVFREVNTGGLCGNNDKDLENDFLPRYRHYSANNFGDFLKSWRISNHKKDPMNGIPIVERDVLLNENMENLGHCQRLIKELLLMLECVPGKDKLELLVRVCVYERHIGLRFTDRQRCDLRCYLTEQLRIMCYPASL